MTVGTEFALAQLRAGADTIGIGDPHRKPAFTGVLSLVYSTPGKALVKSIQQAGENYDCISAKHHPLLPGIADLGVDISTSTIWSTWCGCVRRLGPPS